MFSVIEITFVFLGGGGGKRASHLSPVVLGRSATMQSPPWAAISYMPSDAVTSLGRVCKKKVATQRKNKIQMPINNASLKDTVPVSG